MGSISKIRSSAFSKLSMALWTVAMLLQIGYTSSHELYVVHPQSLARRFRIEGATSKGLVPASLGGFGHYDAHGVF